MLSILLCGLLVAVNAVPVPYYNQHSFDSEPSWTRELDRYFEKQTANMNKFWDNFDRNMRHTMDDLSTTLSKIDGSGMIKGNQYEIKMILSGFQEEDISVKAREGMLVVEASSKYGKNNFVQIMNLPPYVVPSGNWTYENDVLTIVFPLREPQNKPVDDKYTPSKPANKGPDADNDQHLNAGEIRHKPITSSEGLKSEVEMLNP